MVSPGSQHQFLGLGEGDAVPEVIVDEARVPLAIPVRYISLDMCYQQFPAIYQQLSWNWSGSSFSMKTCQRKDCFTVVLAVVGFRRKFDHT